MSGVTFLWNFFPAVKATSHAIIAAIISVGTIAIAIKIPAPKLLLSLPVMRKTRVRTIQGISTVNVRNVTTNMVTTESVPNIGFLLLPDILSNYSSVA